MASGTSAPSRSSASRACRRVTHESCGIASSDLLRAASAGTYDDEREVRDGLTSEKRLPITGE